MPAATARRSTSGCGSTAIAAADRVKAGNGSTAELLDRLKGEAAFGKVDFAGLAAQTAKEFIGRSPEQVAEFVAEHVEPIRKRYAGVLGMQAELHV